MLQVIVRSHQTTMENPQVEYCDRASRHHSPNKCGLGNKGTQLKNHGSNLKNQATVNHLAHELCEVGQRSRT